MMSFTEARRIFLTEKLQFGNWRHIAARDVLREQLNRDEAAIELRNEINRRTPVRTAA